MSAVKGRWMVLEATSGGAWLVERRDSKEEADRLAEALTRGMRSMGDTREYKVREEA